MQTDKLISIDEFCLHHNIEVSFISSLQKAGLIEITTISESGFIEKSQLGQLEKTVRFFYEMDINIEGIETITHLLQKMNAMQDEIIRLRNRLDFYETNI